MAHFLAEIPQYVENRLDDAFGTNASSPGKDKQEIDIGTGRKGRPAIAAYCDDCAGVSPRSVSGRMNI
jgi:hypothetical protein